MRLVSHNMLLVRSAHLHQQQTMSCKTMWTTTPRHPNQHRLQSINCKLIINLLQQLLLYNRKMSLPICLSS
jgi:hypothetical protein